MFSFRFYLIATVLIALTAIIWRPFLFGFYYDDWHVIASGVGFGGCLSPERIGHYWHNYHMRPGLIPFYWLGTCLLSANVMAWQIYALLLNLATAASLGWLGYYLCKNLKQEQEAAILGGAIIATSWLAFPWLLGLTA
jgi:hypothetical protein